MKGRVLLLTTPFRPNVGGVETHLDDLIDEGVKKGLKFFVLTYQPLVTRARGKYIERGKGYVIYRFPWIRANLFLLLEKYPILEFVYLAPGLFMMSFIFIFWNRSKIKVIHAQGLVAGAIGVVMGKLFGKKVVVSTHSIYRFPESGLYSKFCQKLFNGSNHVLTLSKQSKSEVLDLNVNSEKVSVFTYWVNQKIFSPINKLRARKKLGLSGKKFYCLFVGRLVAVKGIMDLIDAARITKTVEFLIIGDGPMADDVRDAQAKLSNLNFIGKIDNRYLPIYYSASDVVIVPSTHEEGFGRVIIESLSCGTPVVGSRRGAIVEAMDESVGVFIDVSGKNISRVLNMFIKNKNKLKRMAKNARKFAVKNYSSDNIQLITKYYG
ncbi:MAG TPA: glycosyltransferase family 4 protein [Patescibacteria group bacterium]